MKKAIGTIIITLALFSILYVLTGCVPVKYGQSEEEAIIAKGKPLIEAWLEKLPEKSELDQVYMENAAGEGQGIFSGSYPSDYVTGEFSAGGSSFRVTVNINTDEVWTDYNAPDLNKAIEWQMKPYFERYGYAGDYGITGAELAIYIYSRDISAGGSSDRINTVGILEGMYPDSLCLDYSDSKMDDFLHDKNVKAFDIRYIKEADDPVLSVKVLADYLKESGNHVSGSELVWTDYRMISMTADAMKTFRSTGNPPLDEKILDRYVMTCEIKGDLDKFDCALRHYAEKREYDFVFSYLKEAAYGTSEDIDDPEFIDLAFDYSFEITPDTVTYEVKDDYLTYLYFDEKPEFTEAVMVYTGDLNPKEQRLEIISLPDGRYSLKDEKCRTFDANGDQALPYYMDYNQKIVFKK